MVVTSGRAGMRSAINRKPTFGDHVALVQRPGSWGRLHLRIDRNVFTEKLDEVRRLRNKVMHFRPDGLGADDVERLRAFARFTRRLRGVTAG